MYKLLRAHIHTFTSIRSFYYIGVHHCSSFKNMPLYCSCCYTPKKSLWIRFAPRVLPMVEHEISVHCFFSTEIQLRLDVAVTLDCVKDANSGLLQFVTVVSIDQPLLQNPGCTQPQGAFKGQLWNFTKNQSSTFRACMVDCSNSSSNHQKCHTKLMAILGLCEVNAAPKLYCTYT